MARSDLLLQLVKSGSKGDSILFKKVVEAIIAEERVKQHNVLADKLQDQLNKTENNTANKLSFTPSKIFNDNKTEDLVLQSVPERTFNDLVLTEETTLIFNQLIEEQTRADLLRSYGLEPRHRVLLVGPPGNGKTSIAEALASSLMVPLFTVKYDSIIASYLGETSTRLKNLFDYTRTQRCVLFFDEFDALGKERGDKHETGEIKRVVSSLLLHIDKLPSYVIVVAATNHPELLDKAVWRRFQIKALIDKPAHTQITKYIEKFESLYDLSTGYLANSLANKLQGLSYSEINDFFQDILRQYVLSIPNNSSNLKSLVTKRLKYLNSTYTPDKAS